MAGRGDLANGGLAEEAARMDDQRSDTERGLGGRPVTQATEAGRALTPQVITIMTTEHYNLQSGRAMTITDANGRASLFLGTVSTSLVALAFVGQISRTGTSLGQAFYVFALVLFPSLVFLGLVTFERVLQSGIEDMVYARGINRIRHLYLEHAPELRPYFILSAHDDEAGAMGNMAMRPGWWQPFLSTGGMIAVINSILTGAFVGVLLAAIFSLALGVSVVAGIATFLVSVFLYQRHQSQRWVRSLTALGVRFPASRDE
jgi:hypothetical protein